MKSKSNMKTIVLKIVVADEHVDEMVSYINRMATEDIRISPCEFARRRGYSIVYSSVEVKDHKPKR